METKRENSLKNKHMTKENRQEIQEGLFRNASFKFIGKVIGKDPTTVSKEVKLHAQTHTNSFVTTTAVCPKLLKAPFVCNGCKLKNSPGCHYTRRIYLADTAQKEYRTTLTESREGIALNKAEFYENDRIIAERVKAGQHIYHIIHTANISSSKSSIYRYLNRGYLSIRPIDLPRAVKFKPRSAKKRDYVPKGVKLGRTYDDFLTYMEENAMEERKEFDTVIGEEGGKVIMTVDFTAMNFMFGILLDNKTAAEASSKLLCLKQKLIDNGFCFGDIFPVILTDNGGEFSDVATFEYNGEDEVETRMFFCDPMQSSQKPFIEKNHTLFRDIIPKGSSFNSFTQETVNLIFSHVNAVKRKSLNGKSPYEVFSFLYSQSLAEVFGIRYIEPQNVIQSKLLQSTTAFKATVLGQ